MRGETLVSGNLYLAWRYLCHHRVTTAVLVASITLVAYLPAALEVIVVNAEQHFRSRAASTPIVIGSRGSPLELVLASLYFDGKYDDVLRMEQLQRVEKQDLGLAIPLHTGFQARGVPIVGTTSDYAELRDFRTAQGRNWSLLGECVVGARVADRFELSIGSKIPVSSDAAFVLDGPPLRLNVVGILEANETADDEAVFVDLKTTWIITGLGHGHVSGAQHGSAEAATYTDITADNVDSFHFHGDEARFPITAIIVVPASEKAETLLIGQYLSPEDLAQVVRPSEVMDSLLQKVLMVRSYMIAIVAVVSLVTLLTIALVLVLSIRLRRDEIATMSQIGCSRFAISTILGSQIAIILAISAVLATALIQITDAYGRELIRLLIL